MLVESDRARKLPLTDRAGIDDPVSADVFLEVGAAGRDVVTDTALVELLTHVDVVNQQMTVAVVLLLELAITDMTLVEDGRTTVMFTLNGNKIKSYYTVS